MYSSSIISAFLLLTVALKLSSSVPIAKTSDAQTITYEQFLGIEIGWTRDQITGYLNNNPGEVISEIVIPPILNMQIVQYTNTNPIAAVVLVLSDNRLTTKSQSGLNPKQYPITREKFNQIKIGMTREQVTSIVGNEGKILSQGQDSIEIIGYNGSPNTYAVVQITFSTGHVISKTAVGL